MFNGKGPDRALLTSYERDAIRPYVFGHFKDMLARDRPSSGDAVLSGQLAIAGSCATTLPVSRHRMARRPGLNENYGRELMELHTLGVDGGYTQQDVIAVARAFTGWTIYDPQKYGEFQFNPAGHDRKEKMILGHTLPAGRGEQDGLDVIDILAHHPSTAKFISRKLAQRFVADDPPQALDRPHGRDIYQNRWRSSRGASNHVQFGRVHVGRRMASENEIAARNGGRAPCAL